MSTRIDIDAIDIEAIPTSELLKLENQICFPLYACSKEVVRAYTPYLEKLDLTYTQYLVMMALWEYGDMSVGEMGDRLYLDSGTLTPLLKKLEAKGFITRRRSTEDERNLIVTITEAGEQLKEIAVEVPEKMNQCINLSEEESATLYRTLYKLLSQFEEA